MRRNRKKMLITGVSGLLGGNLAYYFKDEYAILGLYNSHPVSIEGIFTEKCELLKPEEMKEIISEYRPDIILHCASLTNIDECQRDKSTTKDINVLTTKNIVDEVINSDVKMIYISTDAVYDGFKGHFSEDDEVNPQNIYGQTKYEGELEVLRHSNFLIFRTNFFGWNIQNKHSLAEWILKELKANKGVNGFRDAYFSTIYTMELARVIDISIKKNLIGVYNCGGLDSCSKYEFALKIASQFGFDKKLVIPISINDFNFKAKRGKNLTLNTNKLQKALNYKLPTVKHSIEVFYRDYKRELPEQIGKNQVESKQISNVIQYGRQYIDEEDIKSVIEVLQSLHLTQGPMITEFESDLCNTVGARYAVACNSGTSALHIACLAASVTHGDEVITSPNTFVASANCSVHCGARPIFADIAPNTYNVSPQEIDKKITRHTKAIIPVNFAGQSCDMEEILQIKKDGERKYGHKICIIEDACHALGSLYKNRRVGSCAFSDMAVMSFHPVKHITTGEGGAIFTNDENLYKKLKLFRSHGITSDPEDFVNRDLAFQSTGSDRQPLISPWYYEQNELGYNYRITDIQCALGLSQLKKLSMFRKHRRQIVNTYNEAFCNSKYVQIPFETPECDSNFHLYVLLFDFEKIRIDRAQFMLELKKKGIQTQVHYIPVHLQSYYRKHFGTNWGDCPNAEDYYRKCLSIPLYPAMTKSDVEKVINEITSLIRGN